MTRKSIPIDELDTNPRALTSEQCLFILALAAQQMVWVAGERATSPIAVLALLFFAFAGILLIWRGQDVPCEQIFSRYTFWIVFAIGCVAAFAAVVARYYSLHYATFDTGVFANLSYHFLKTGNYYSTLLGFHGFADHFTPILMLLSPIFLIAPTFLWLPLLKAISFLLCPIVLLKFSSLVVGERNPLRFFVPLLWLESPLLARVFEMEFQPSTLALPLVLYAFLCAQRQQWARVWITLLLVSCFKENMVLAWPAVGLFTVLQERDRMRGIALSCFGIFLGLVIYFVLMPALSNGTVSPHVARFGPLSLIGLKLKLLVTALLSVSFIPCLAWPSLPFVFAGFGLALLTKSEIMLDYSHHYQDLPLACLMIATVLGLRNLNSLPLPRVALQRIFAVILLVVVLQANRSLTRRIRTDFPSRNQMQVVEEIATLRREIGDREIEVWAIDALGPYLFTAPNLKPIIDVHGPFASRQERLVVVADAISSWPLDKADFKQLSSRLTNDALTSIATVDSHWQTLKVYRYNQR